MTDKVPHSKQANYFTEATGGNADFALPQLSSRTKGAQLPATMPGNTLRSASVSIMSN